MSAFVILIIGAGIGIAFTIWVTGWIENGTRQIEAAKRACLDNEAADHDEPSRIHVESAWTDEALERVIAATESPFLFDADEFTDTPIYSATAAHIARYEAESIAAEWAELNGSGGAA